LIPVELRIPSNEGLDRVGGQVVGTDAGQEAAIAADRGPDAVAEKGGFHFALHSLALPCMALHGSVLEAPTHFLV